MRAVAVFPNDMTAILQAGIDHNAIAGGDSRLCVWTERPNDAGAICAQDPWLGN